MTKYWREASALIIASKINFHSNIASKSNSVHSSQGSNINYPVQNVKTLYKRNPDYKVLLLRRSAKSSFMPEGFVFPGGVTAPADNNEGWRELFNDSGFAIDDFDHSTHLAPIFHGSKDSKIAKAISLRITAIRETFEESGILICKSRHDQDQDIRWASYLSGGEILEWQRKVQEKPSELLSLCKMLECVPDIWSLHLWSNWLTPVTFPKRFDAVFFIALLDQIPPTFIDGIEVDEMKWYTTPDILYKVKSGLPTPQLYEVCRLNNFEKIDHLANFAVERAKLGCERWMPVLVETSDGLVSFLPAGMTNPDLPTYVQEVLQKHGLNSLDAVLLCSGSKACRFLDLPKDLIDDVKLAAAKSSSCVGFVSALQAHTSLTELHQRLSTGCQILDGFLHGGFALRGITEITGESGTGKTQVCLQLSLSVQYPKVYGGMDSGAVFINTEKIFPTRRLQELIRTFSPSHHEYKISKPNVNFGDNIFLEHIPDADTLVKCITRSLPVLLSRKSVGLIVIDSIAGVFRADYDQKDMVQRAHDLQLIGKTLHKLARKFSVAVVCVNQVSCVPVDTLENEGQKPQTVAALSLAWGNLVTSRLQLFRESEIVMGDNQNLVLRRMEAIFSPHLPQRSCQFAVTSGGVFGIR